MGNLLFIMFPNAGSYLPAFALAKRLEAAGHVVEFLGFADFDGLYRRHGIHAVYLESFPGLDDVAPLFQAVRIGRFRSAYEALLRALDRLLASVVPGKVLLDARLHLCAAPIMRRGMPIISIKPTYAPTYFAWGRPPITSGLAPKDGMYFPRLALAWVVYFCTVPVIPRIAVLIATGISGRFRQEARAHGYRPVFSPTGLSLRLQEIVLAPRQLDFSAPFGTRYHGLSIDSDRPETELDTEIPANHGRLAILSLGTRAGQYRQSAKIFVAGVEAFRGLLSWQLVVHAGQAGLPKPDDLPPNVTWAEEVPMLALLKKSELLITHGGLGSVKEAVAAGVPMLVIPMAYDQKMNGARVRFHCLGFVMPACRCNPASLREAVSAVSGDAGCREACAKFAACLLSEGAGSFDLPDFDGFYLGSGSPCAGLA